MPSNAPFIFDSADKVPPRPAGEPPHRMIRGSDFDRPQQPPLVAYLPWPAWVVAGVIALVVVGLIAWWVARWAARNPELAELGQLLLMTLLFVLTVAGTAWTITALYFSLMARYGTALASLFGRSRLGNLQPLPTMARQSLSDVAAFERAAIEMQIAIAPHQEFPLLSTKSDSSENGAPVTINGLTEEQAPAGVPSAEWLSWIDQTPHLMIAGRTNAGKTTLASAILAERIQAGDEVLVIDPHDQPDKWFGVQAVGGGRQYGAILAMLEQVVMEMDDRYQAYNSGTPTSAFTRLTVLVDEVPAIMDACLNEKRKMVDARWSNFARQLGSEARKVRISVVLMTQSVLVQDIGINTAMRKNFSRIALGDEVRRLLAEEENHERRTTLTELVRGQAHPAVMEYRGEIHVLNTSDVPALAAQDVRSYVRLWRSALKENNQNQSGSPVSEQSRAQSVAFTDDQRDEWVRVMLRDGRTWRDIRSRLNVAGLTIDNNRLAELSQAVRAEQSKIEPL